MCGDKNRLLDDAGRHLLAAGVLGDSLGSFADGVLGQFTRQEETNCSLDFARRDRFLLVLERETRSFGSDTLEDVVDEGVHDAHGLGRNSDIGVDLLQDVVDVDGIGLLPLGLLLLVSLGDGLGGLSCSFGSLSGGLWGHVDRFGSTDELTDDCQNGPPFIPSW